MHRPRGVLLALAALACGAPATPLVAQTAERETGKYERYGGIPDRFMFRGGLYVPRHSTTATLSSETLGLGTPIDFETLLGLAKTTGTFRGELSFRLGRRHRFRLGAVAVNRTAVRTLDEQIVWPPDTFDIGFSLTTSWNLVLVPFDYRFAPIKTDRIDIGLSIGVFAFFLDAGFASPQLGESRSQRVRFPLPVLGLDAEIALAPRLMLQAKVKHFRIGIDRADGNWSEAGAALEYHPWRRLGFGLGYTLTDIGGEYRTTITAGEIIDVDARLRVDYRFRGPIAYLILGF